MRQACASSDLQAGANRLGPRFVAALALLCAILCGADPVHAAGTSELWPELSGFWQLNERSRAYFDAAYALGKESDLKSADIAAYLDLSLKPIARMRTGHLTDDWQRNKYLWARIGYDRIFEATDSDGVQVVENRGVFAFYGRVPLPAAFWLETRTRADFRWIGDDYSNRYRFRLDLSHEYTVFDHAVVPYFNYEWFYDTRYNEWSRTLSTLGAEVTATPHFRYEVYLAQQVDRRPEHKDLNALGIALKWYH